MDVSGDIKNAGLSGCAVKLFFTAYANSDNASVGLGEGTVFEIEDGIPVVRAASVASPMALTSGIFSHESGGRA